MKQCIDIYNKWIVAFVDGAWRHVYVPAGWVAFARRDEPNQHLGVCWDTAIDATGARGVEALGTSSVVLVGPQVTDQEILDNLDTRRVGWVATISAGSDANQPETPCSG